MPLMQIFTSLSRSQVPENLGQLAAVALSKTMRNKPLERICVHVCAGEHIFAGSQPEINSPSAFAILRAIGSVELEDNRKTVEAITDLLHEQLNIPRSEVRLFFDDYSPDMVALNGKVISDMLAGK